MEGGKIAARARALVGVRFRPQGRDPERGLDCLGMAALALGVPAAKAQGDYRLSASDDGALSRALLACGLVKIDPGEAREGDLLVVSPGLGRLHAVILTGGGYVHADARLRRVAEVPGPLPWPVRSAWRAAKDDPEKERD